MESIVNANFQLIQLKAGRAMSSGKCLRIMAILTLHRLAPLTRLALMAGMNKMRLYSVVSLKVRG